MHTCWKLDLGSQMLTKGMRIMWKESSLACNKGEGAPGLLLGVVGDEGIMVPGKMHLLPAPFT